MAEKIIALSRRALGKDIYDVHLALGMKSNIKKVLGHIKRITGREPDEIIKNACYLLDRINLKSSDMVELKDAVPVQHREDVKVMISSLQYELGRMIRKS
ncbi:MAG: hypothetical protein ACP5H8_03150 [Candidatus Micrarchaeia archaeon]